MTPGRRSILVAVVLAATVGLAAGHAHAGAILLDLSGTWAGVIKCKSLRGGVKDKFTLTPTMRIAQTGNALGIILDYGTGTDAYVATLVPDAKKPDAKGELALVYCKTNDLVGDEPDFDELGRMSLKAKPLEIKATFKGTSIFSDPGVFTDTEAGTCKWSFKRTAVDFPMVPLTCTP